MKLLGVILIAFYGHLLAVAAYDLIIAGIVEYLADRERSYYFNIARIILGLALEVLGVVTIAIVTLKRFKLLYGSGGALAVCLAAYIIIYVLHMSINYKNFQSLAWNSLIVECAIKIAVIAGGIALTFAIAARGPYDLVQQ
jgi:hypothetical protein